MPPALYPRQREILTFISQYIRKYGSAPTLSELAKAFDVAITTIFEHLNVLESKGFLRKHRGMIRGLEIVNDKFFLPTSDDSSIPLPIMGLIAAGQPLEPYPNSDTYFSVSASLLKPKRLHYILQVKGDSMIEEGILDGDYVIVEHRETAENGEIVVALLKNGLATLKRIFFEKDRIKLEPANQAMPPIYTKEVQIQGCVVGIIRRY